MSLEAKFGATIRFTVTSSSVHPCRVLCNFEFEQLDQKQHISKLYQAPRIELRGTVDAQPATLIVEDCHAYSTLRPPAPSLGGPTVQWLETGLIEQLQQLLHWAVSVGTQSAPPLH